MSHRRALREQRIAVPLSEKVVQRRTAPTVAVRWARARGQDLHRQSRFPAMLRSTTYGVTNAEPRKKGEMERETRLELATSTLARWCSTN